MKDSTRIASIVGIITLAVVMFFVCAVLVCVMFMQFKTVEEANITDIENMRETELRTALAEWKSKYEETDSKLKETNKKITEYNEKIEKNEAASGLIDKEYQQSNLILGKTDVYGEGVVITLKDSTVETSKKIRASDLVDLINELRYAGAEAISINDIRVIGTTAISEINNAYIKVDGKRLESPYVVRAIGNQAYLLSVLNMKNSGFIDRYTNDNYIVECESRKRVEILRYNGEITASHLQKEE